MARINLTNVVVAVGAGGVDELLEWQDQTKGRTGAFKGWTDWGRVGLALAAHLGIVMGVMPQYAEPLATAETTLVTKSLVRVIRERGGVGAAPQVSASRVARINPMVANQVSRSYQPEFKSTAAW